MARVILFPYRMPSESGRALRDALEGMGHKTMRVFANGKYRPRKGDTIINWGNHTPPGWLTKAQYLGLRIVNSMANVLISRDKRLAFLAFAKAGVSTPKFAVTWEEAQKLDMPVMQYRSATAQGGSGVSYIEDVKRLSLDCELWTSYIKKHSEFRVHVMHCTVIDVQQKKRRKDFEGETNYKVRNLAGGWVYAREGIEVPTCVREQAVLAVGACGLDFGAVDVIYNKHHSTAYVLEINSAPGLEGNTVVNYAGSLLQMVKGK